MAEVDGALHVEGSGIEGPNSGGRFISKIGAGRCITKPRPDYEQTSFRGPWGVARAFFAERKKVGARSTRTSSSPVDGPAHVPDAPVTGNLGTLQSASLLRALWPRTPCWPGRNRYS